MTGGDAELFDERVRLCSLSCVPSVTASPTEVLVSTGPGKSRLITSGPLGTTATRSSRSAVASSVHAFAASLLVVTVIAMLASVFA